MRESLKDDPCRLLMLANQHIKDFRAPLLAPEREHLVEQAKMRLQGSDAGACVPQDKSSGMRWCLGTSQRVGHSC